MVAAGVPDFRLTTALAFAGQSVICTEAQQFGSIADLFPAQLRAHVGEIDITGFLICDIDSDVAASFTTAVIVGDRPAAARGRKASTRSEASVLHSVAKSRVHHYGLEGRSRHVVFVECAIQERLFSLVII